MKNIFFAITLITFSFNIPAQITGLLTNPALYSETNGLKSDSILIDTTTYVPLSLPFYDDFAYYDIYPDQNLWADKYAYINRNFALNPVTVGTATLDAFDENGKIYRHASSTTFEADKLTSRPINLKNFIRQVPSNSLYIKKDNSYVLLKDKYIFSNSENSYTNIAQDVKWYTASVALYSYDTDIDSFADYKEKLYFKNSITGEYEYIKGSEFRSDSIEKYALKDSILFSFFVEKKGIMDEPEKGDSLVLQFNVPYDTTGIFINEIYNSSIEIYNATQEKIDISSFAVMPKTLAVTEDTLKKYALKPISKKYASAFDFVIGTNNSIAQHWQNNDTLYLYSLEKQMIIDSIYYSTETKKDISIGRKSDGSKNIVIQSEANLGVPNSQWLTVWSSANDSIPTDKFVQKIISINRLMYLSDAFRFRFINHASLSTDESTARAEDFWHVDYIYFNAELSAKNVFAPEVAFTSTLEPFYKNYHAIPLEHAKRLNRDDFINEFSATFKNLSTEMRTINLYFQIKNNTSNTIEKNLYISNQSPPGKTAGNPKISLIEGIKEKIYLYDILENDFSEDSSSLTFSLYYIDETSKTSKAYRWNDTISHTQNFHNYYAYDDGTAEAGYGLRGGEMLRGAYKFNMLKSDTLRAVKFYFNETLTRNIFFNLCIWAESKEKPGTPGELLYLDEGKMTSQKKDFDGFTTYNIDPAKIKGGADELITDRTFFIGWEQPKDLSINIGVDLNTQKSSLVYQNYGFDWEASLISNPLMIRAIVGNKLPTSVSVIKKAYNTVKVTPNPASNYIYIDTDYSYAEIINTMGNTLIKTDGNPININYLPTGVYIIKTANSTGALQTGRFIKK